MPTDHIRYDLLAREALRGVVQRVLADVAKNGLAGDHHFYISFDTRAPGVRISPRLREKYPEEMTVVLQHQFWDLIVSDEGFEVGLSFNGVPERLGVPLAAIKGFFDPSVQFALDFEMGAEAGERTNERGAAPPPAGVRPPVAAASDDEPGAKPHRTAHAKAAKAPSAAAPALPDLAAKVGETDDKPDRPPGSGEVVRLDRFRKK
jgi:hypothetical protein